MIVFISSIAKTPLSLRTQIGTQK